MRLVSRAIAISVLLLSMGVAGAAAQTQPSTPFCAGGDCAQTRAVLKNLCDFIVANKAQFQTIYIGGYYMRTLVAGYEILGDKRYLDTAIAYGDYLLARQMPNGFWRTGYGPAPCTWPTPAARWGCSLCSRSMLIRVASRNI